MYFPLFRTIAILKDIRQLFLIEVYPSQNIELI